MYEALLKYAYPLNSLMSAMFEIETPASKAERVERLDRPLDDFSFRDVLEEIWRRQSGESMKDQVPVRTLWQSNPVWRDNLDFDAFSEKLIALSHFSGRLMVLDMSEKIVHIIHHPAKVAEHVTRMIDPAVFGLVDGMDE